MLNRKEEAQTAIGKARKGVGETMNYLMQSQLHVQSTLARTSFDGFDKKSIKVARDFLKKFKDFLFIYGDVGVGKTQFLADMIREFIMTREPYVRKVENGSTNGVINWDEKWTFHQVAFIKEAEFFNYLKSLWQYGENKLEIDKIEKFKKVDLFFIDDMGVKGEAPWVYERYYQIIAKTRA